MKFCIDFAGWIEVEAKDRDEAMSIFWNWVGSIQDDTLTDWYKVILKTPWFDVDLIEEED